ncbi:MAG: carboxymuconolactone decarboxylase [Hamadaea sp.]|uniref:carboxymuconolactone decarboxylase family protein n=1 Tax=Hamadaea sp. TaxID=2024425 RepID=UPI0017CF4B84|nr:carboxymuconolactone decarboxylase family protein [Hamadaea sp.]NUT18387.1 carboxymuconolactone decarboxylase [Hamadaea sp.]
MGIRRIASSVAQRQIKYVTPVPITAARGLLGEVYGQVLDEMGLVVPPVQLHSPVPELAAAYWALLREPLLPTATVSRAVKEAVATAVSVANVCPYCVDMHSVGLYDLASESVAEALIADRPSEIADPSLAAVARWARDPFGSAYAFREDDRAELVGVVVAMHYLTRMVNVFLSSFLLPPGLGPASRRRFKHGVARILRPTLRDPRTPGRALPLLPPAPLPGDAAWAQDNPAIASAVGRAYAAFEAAGERSVPPAVRELLDSRLETWQGEDTGISRVWCERLLLSLDEELRPVGRLVLLTAIASYQVDDEVIAEFRAVHPADRTLVEAAAWASHRAARSIGSRLVHRTLGDAYAAIEGSR